MHVPDPTDVPSEVRHLRRVEEDDGGEGEAQHVGTQEVGWWPMAGCAVFWCIRKPVLTASGQFHVVTR